MKTPPTRQDIEPMDIEKVWQEFFRTRSEVCRNQLLVYYIKLVRYTAERIWVKLPEKVDIEDLIQAGIFGLLDAINAYDMSRGVKFETYCTPRIRGSILDELRNTDWVPRLVRSRAHHLERARARLEAQLGRIPTEQELADELDMDDEEFCRLQRDANAVGLISLNNTFNDADGDKELCELDIIEDTRSANPVTEAQKRDLKNLISKGLSRAEKLILYLYYYEEMTMKEIGATLDLSESRVSQMHSSVIDRLKAQMNSRKREFLLSDIAK